MFDSQGHRKLWLAAATAGLFMVVGCSDQATNQADAAPVAKKAAPAKPAGAKALKPANKSEGGKTVAVSSKVTPATKLVTVPKGTAISATIGKTLASNKNHAGDSFAASLSTPVKVGGKTVIPQGAHVTGRVVAAQKKDPAKLTVALSSVEIDGKSYPLETNSIGPSDKAKKDLSVPAKTQLKFKLAKSVKMPVKG